MKEINVVIYLFFVFNRYNIAIALIKEFFSAHVDWILFPFDKAFSEQTPIKIRNEVTMTRGYGLLCILSTND